MDAIIQKWIKLEADKSQHTGYIRLREKSVLSCSFYLAVEKPSNSRAILLEVNSSSINCGIVFPKSVAIEVFKSAITPRSNGVVRIILKLIDSRYLDIFSVLVSDIIDHIKQHKDEKIAVIEFISRITRWQAFLRKYSFDGLNDNAQIGLYGELWFLNEYILNNIAANSAVNSWEGSDGSNQDFQLVTCAIEVKTTATEPHKVIPISSIHQLDETGIEKLLLFHLAIDVHRSGVQSLPELIFSIRNNIEAQDSNALLEFNDKLTESGYLDVHKNNYSHRKYTVRSSRFLEVHEDFPRILENDLKPGVGDVRYSLTLDSCLRFSIENAKVKEIIKESFSA